MAGKTLDEVLGGAEEEFEVDFSGVELKDGGDFGEPLPKGEYRFLIKDVEKGRTKADDADKFHWTFALDQPEGAAEAARNGKRVHLHATLSKGDAFRNVQTLQAVGLDTSKGLKFKKADVVDEHVNIFVDVENDDNKVVKVKPVPGAAKPTGKGRGRKGAAAL